MAKRTAIIDIGSNSISLVVYEKSSRYAFHLIEKIRSKVRIGEGAYLNGGHISDKAMQNAYSALRDFSLVSKSLGCKKVLCVATSALRDAPNKVQFVKKIDKELGIKIKIIDGKKEAYFGAVAALNLLPKIDSVTTIDIGGGSTELAKIENGEVIDCISLDIGTVRLKELFSDNKTSFFDISTYIDDILQTLPDLYKSRHIVGIGGTIRALSFAILKNAKYPIDSLHSFEYSYSKNNSFIVSISKSSTKELKKSSISKSRYDTISQGSSIFYKLCNKLESKTVIVSKAGVREGVYLCDILRNSNNKFPHNFNVSIKNLIDRFAIYNKHIPHLQRSAAGIYDQIHHIFDPKKKYQRTLLMASKLLLIARRINIYSNSDMGFSFLVENLNFTLSHKEKILIAIILKFAHKNSMSKKDIKKLDVLLPSKAVIEWLSFILSLTVCINKNKTLKKIEVKYSKDLLTISGKESLFLCQECVNKLKKPIKMDIQILKSST